MARSAVDSNRDLLIEELNVKDVRRLDSLDGYARAIVKLDYPRLGKRLRGDVVKVQEAIKAGAYTLSRDGTRVHAAGHDIPRTISRCTTRRSATTPASRRRAASWSRSTSRSMRNLALSATCAI